MKKKIKIGLISILIIGSLSLNTVLKNEEKVNAVERQDAIQLRDGNHNTLLKRDGTVWSWGANDYGQFGSGTYDASTNMTQAENLTNVVKISGNRYRTFVLKENGTVWAMGDNSSGELGDGTYNEQLLPVQVLGEGGVGYLTDIVDISTSIVEEGDFSLALAKDGTVYAWGNNYYGIFGDGVSSSQFPIKISNLDKVVKIAAVHNHALAIKRDGTVWAWGGNYLGTLGDGTSTDSSTPIQVLNLTNMKEVYGGYFSSMALKNDGTVWAWGNNVNGQIGDGTTNDKYEPTQVIGLTNIIKIISGVDGGLALDTNGEVWAWGANYQGQLGIGNKEDQYIPIKISNLTGIVDIGMSTNHSTALKANGEVWGWGSNLSDQLGNRPEVQSSIPLKLFSAPPDTIDNPFTNVSQISTGNSHVVALKTDGTVWTWGANAIGRLGDGSKTDKNAARKIEITDIIQVSTKGDHTLALKSDGTVWAWGNNGNGQLGTGNYSINYVPVKVNNLTNVDYIAAGTNHSLALKNDGTVWAWGGNQKGQLGIGNTTNKNIPVKINTSARIVQIYAGKDFSVALDDNSVINTWGANESGQLGDGTTIQKTTPVLLPAGNTIEYVAVGDSHSFIRTHLGELFAWGNNTYGQLGDGTKVNKNVPTSINGTINIRGISAGKSHSLVVASDGTVKSWGLNSFGQLGLGNSGVGTDRTVPTSVTALTNVKNVGAAGNYSMFLHNDGTVTSLGSNIDGTLGNGTNTNSLTPVSIIQQIVIPPEPEPIIANIPYFKIIKTFNAALNIIELSIQENNVVEGTGKELKYSTGLKTLDYFIAQGTDIVSSLVQITENGIYNIFLKDDRGYEWKESILINELDGSPPPIIIAPEINTENKEYLIPIYSSIPKININYSYEGSSPTTALEIEINGTTNTSIQEDTPIGTNVDKLYTVDFPEISNINERLNATFKLKDQDGNTSIGKNNIIEFYYPNLTMKSSLNSTLLEWDPSQLANVEYILQRDGIEIYRGTSTSYDDTNIVLNTNYQYKLKTKHNESERTAYITLKKSGNYTFQILGDIQLSAENISLNTISKGESATSPEIKFIQIADIQKDYKINMTMTPFISTDGTVISAENFKMENVLVKDRNNGLIETKTINFTNNAASTLINETHTVIDKQVKLVIPLTSLKLNIPTELKINDMGETFSSNITYVVEWGP